MPLGVAAEQDEADAAEFERLRAQDTANGDNLPLDGDPAGAQPQGDAAAGAAAAATDPPKTEGTPATTPAAATTSQPAAAAEPQKGDPTRAALRASRHAERRATAEAERLRRENEELRKQVPAKTTDADVLTDEDITRVEEDYPAVGKVARALKHVQETAAAQPAKQAATTTDTEFVPEALDPAVQAIVDDIPDLLAWQNSPDQSRFELARAQLQVLSNHPKWKDALPDALLKEATRRVNAELGQATQQPTTATTDIDPKKALENAPVRTPQAVSELGGGGGGEPTNNDVARFQRMSEDDVFAELATRGG